MRIVLLSVILILLYHFPAFSSCHPELVGSEASRFLREVSCAGIPDSIPGISTNDSTKKIVPVSSPPYLSLHRVLRGVDVGVNGTAVFPQLHPNALVTANERQGAGTSIHGMSTNDSTKRIMPIIFSRCASPLNFEMMPFFKSSVHDITIGGDALFQSNAITPAFLYSIYNSEFIDDNSKINQFNKLRAKNGVGLEAAAGLSFSWKRDSSRFTHTIGLYERSVDQLKFSNGLFYLTFFGNGNAEQAVIEMGNNEANFMQFSQLQYSVKYDVSPTLKIYGGISLLIGQSYQHALLKNGDLYTDTLGESISVSYDFNYQGNNGVNNWYQANGQGFSLDGGIVISKDPSRYVFSAGFSDLSYFTWNSNTSLYAATGSKKFEGLDVANLFALTDTTFKKINKDSILHYFNVDQRKGKAYDVLPFGLNVAYQFRTTRDFIWSFRASYKPDFYWYPRLEVRGGKYFMHDKLCFMLNAGAGGFETFFAGAGIYGIFPVCPSSAHPKTLSAYLSSDHLTSLFFPNDMMGASARVGVSFAW